MARFDYIVVGGGSAGCIAAAELAKKYSVLLLEGGDAAERHPETLTADGYKKAFINPSLMWDRFSTKQSGLGGNRIFMGSGRGLGGSGSINGMVYTRGDAKDYDAWPEGWRWNDVCADFESIESKLRVRRRTPTKFTEACIRAAEESGFRHKEDLNDGDLGGLDGGVLGYEWMNFEGDDRRSSYVAYVKPERGTESNLTVMTKARVQRITFDGDKRATGVEYVDPYGHHRVDCEREVLLAAGALESPKLLMLSGVGPSEELRRHGIPVICDIPELGRNLHDHPNVSLFFHGQEDVDCNYPQLYGFHRVNPRSLAGSDQPDTCFVFYPARSSLREGMMRLLPGMMLPPSLYRYEGLRRGIRFGVSAAFATSTMQRFVERVYGIVVILGKPKSRGRLTLASANPEDQAELDPGYFADPEDMKTMIAGVHKARAIAASRSLSDWGNRELMPSPLSKSDDAIQRFIRRNAMTTYHYAGTCRMGEDARAVVRPDLRVRGVSGVRVVDASAIPETPVSAMNAPSMLVGYRGAQAVLAS